MDESVRLQCNFCAVRPRANISQQPIGIVFLPYAPSSSPTPLFWFSVFSFEVIPFKVCCFTPFHTDAFVTISSSQNDEILNQLCYQVSWNLGSQTPSREAIRPVTTFPPQHAAVQNPQCGKSYSAGLYEYIYWRNTILWTFSYLGLVLPVNVYVLCARVQLLAYVLVGFGLSLQTTQVCILRLCSDSIFFWNMF